MPEANPSEAKLAEAKLAEANRAGTSSSSRSLLKGLIGFAVAIGVGALLSSAPLFVIKVAVATVLVGCYGYFTVQTVSALKIDSGRVRAVLGVLLGVSVVYLTWAVRIPIFAGGDVPFSFDPGLIYAAILDRAGAMQIQKGFGYGTSADGPSWLLLSTYILEALAFAGIIFLAALLASPDGETKIEKEREPGETKPDPLLQGAGSGS